MADVKITPERIRELEKAERKLQALENAGVDNWDGYDIALDEIAKEESHEKYLDELADEIADAISGHIEEPAGRGGDGTVSCGYGLKSEAYDGIVAVLRRVVPKANEVAL